MIPDKILEQLKNIKALADAGIDGEVTAASILLQSKLAKYNLSIDDLINEKIQKYYIKYTDDYDRRIVAQTCYKFEVESWLVQNSVTGHKIKELLIECTPLQYADIILLVDHARKIWAEEQELFFNAFVQAQQLFPDNSGNPDKEYTAEEYARILKINELRTMIDSTKPNKRLS